MAIGSRARCGKEIEEGARAIGAGYMVIGDAAMAKRALNAVREAFDAALTFDDPQVHADVTKPQKIVAVTGVTGTMGQETLKQLLPRGNRFKIRAFARPSEVNREKNEKNLQLRIWKWLWGDLGNYEDIKKLVDGADYVLHIGAMVSPAADKYPEKTLYTKYWFHPQYHQGNQGTAGPG